MAKKRVLIIVKEYPQISETYIAVEANTLWSRYETEIIGLVKPNMPNKYYLPHIYQEDMNPAAIAEVAQNFSADVIHGHYIFLANLFYRLAKMTGVPFTIRTHSFDVLGHNTKRIRYYAPAINSEYCLGILAFPFARPLLEEAGIAPEKIHDCWPVIDFDRFYDTSPNGEGIMNVGACIPKKFMEGYVMLASQMPKITFDLYPLGYVVERIEKLNESLNRPVNIVPPVEPRDMPREYKKHEWLVYTASPKLRNIGWPLAVAEAQASGVGVCLQNVRPDLREYVGEAGYVFDTLDDAARIISQPFSSELRELGFAHSRKSDVNGHIDQLEDLWAQAWGEPDLADQITKVQAKANVERTNVEVA